jgi:hypothetical protein
MISLLKALHEPSLIGKSPSDLGFIPGFLHAQAVGRSGPVILSAAA